MRLLPYAASALAVAVVGVGVHVLTRVAPLPHVSILFLMPVVMTAALWGLGPSVLAAVLSVAAESFFFYAPIFSFRVASAQELTDLAVFVGVAAITSRLAANVRTQALEARRRQETVGKLLAFNERLAASSDADLHATIARGLSSGLAQPVHFLPAEDGSWVAPAPDDGPLPEPVRQAAAQALAGVDTAVAGWRIEPLATAQGVVGVVAARDAGPVDTDYTKALLEHAALAIERARLRRAVADARVRAQGEVLRDALLNSVSHDLHTPVSVILGSAAALESLGDGPPTAAQRELVATIRQEGERLASHIENVLDLTRIRAGHLSPRLELVELGDIVDAALRRKRQALIGHPVHVDLPADLPMLRLDIFLVEHAIANVLDNAAKYAPPGSAVVLAARVEGPDVVLDVSDEGEGIPEQERERIFEPFHRGAGPVHAPASGTGLGLAICRAFIAANGGSVSALGASAGKGTTVRLILPIPHNIDMSEGTATDE